MENNLNILLEMLEGGTFDKQSNLLLADVALFMTR